MEVIPFFLKSGVTFPIHWKTTFSFEIRLDKS